MAREDPLIEAMWDEWATGAVREGPDADVELAGLLVGTLPAQASGEGGLVVRLRRPRAARRIAKLWRVASWTGGTALSELLDVPARPGARAVLRLPPPIEDAALSLSAATPSSARLPAALRHAWLRGLWGSCGSLYLPRRGQRLQLRVARASVAKALSRALERSPRPWRARTFRGAFEIALRAQDDIQAFLCDVGLNDAALALEERAIVRSMRDHANRMSNCDEANIRRTLAASALQTELAERARAEGLLPRLPPALRDLAEARLAAPEASLSELGARMSPPVTKSAVKYRWARLERLLGEPGIPSPTTIPAQKGSHPQ